MHQATVRFYLLLSLTYKASSACVVATYATFLLTKGLNLFQISLVNAVFFTTMFLAEIPTGAIADVYGRKASFFCACAFHAIGMFMYAVAQSFWGFIAAEVVIAVGSTCATGAFEAWLVDSLKHYGHTEEEVHGLKRRIFAREEQLNHCASIGAGLLGAWFATWHPVAPWLVGGIGFSVAGVLTLVVMREDYFVPQRYRMGEGVDKLKQTVVSGVSYARTHPSVRFLMVLSTVQAFTVMAPNMQWQPLFLPLVRSEADLGFVWAGMAFALAIGSGLTVKTHGWMKHEAQALVLTQLAIGLGIGLTVLCRPLSFALVIFLLHEIARGLWRPLKRAYLNDHIPSQERATIISCESVVNHLGGTVGLILSGGLAHATSISTTWVVVSAILIMATFVVARFSRAVR